MRHITNKGLLTFNQIANLKTLVPPASILPSIVGVRHYSLPSSNLPKASPSFVGGQEIRQYTQKAAQQPIKAEDIEIVTLSPDKEEDFQTFKKIITSEKVVFTSSWVDSKFGIENLKEHCSDFEAKLKLAKKGTDGVFVSKNELSEYKKGKSAFQIALNNFFSDEKNDEQLRDIYTRMTSKADEGLGYYKFTDKDGKLLGGGALAPLASNDITSQKTDTVDIALHILEPKKGIGSTCINTLLKKAFDEHGIKQVWGSSIIEHLGTPTLCAKYGMVMYNDEKTNKKYYYIDKDMFDHNSKIFENIKNPLSAATQYFSKTNEEGDKGR